MKKQIMALLSLEPIQRTKTEVLRFLKLNGPQHAAAMAFFALLALLPGVLLLASALARLMLEVPVEGEASPLDQTLDSIEMALPAFKGSVRNVVADLAASQPSMTTVSAISLLMAAGGAFSALERGVNIMLGTEERRHFLGTRFLLAGMMLSTALALFLWRVVSSMAPRVLETIGVEIPMWLLSNPASEILIQLGGTAAGFYILIRVLATEKFSRLARWTGALTFAVLFFGARVGLDYYLATTPLQQVYGTAMAFIGLILWLYTVAILLLLSCSVIHAMNLWVTDNALPPEEPTPVS